MIDRPTIDRIMDATNIVDVVSEFVSLRKSGTSYKGLCPFHDDRTPSFSVSPSRGVYKCFSCGKAGNAVNFIMEHEQMTYPEALKWLARKYGIEVKERELSDEEREQENERESIFIVNEWAAGYYHDVLFNDPDGQAIGLAYFRQRGFRDDIIRKFRLGFALSKRDAMISTARKKGYKDTFLVKSGLCGQRENGTLYERFAGRVMFPWMSVSGKVFAFGGRLLDSRTKGVSQKYVNSPDSPIYHKDHELYGIYQAKKAIVKEDCVYMVEGYTDVIAMHQCGLENVVANSGTALSIHQIKLLRRFTQNIVLLYDGDEAGIHAAMRGTDMLLAEAMNVKVLLLPDGDDPDSFSRKHTAQEFKEYIDSHQTDFIQFKTDLLLKGVSDPIKKAEAINNIIRSIAVIPDPMVRTAYIKDCSQRLDVDERTLISQTNKYIAGEREEAEKRIAREQEREQEAPQPTADLSMTGLTPKDKEVERLLVKNIIRHGNEVIFSGMETEDGQFIDLNVAQYIDYDLGSDGLTFSDDRYNRILQEAVAHSADPGFESERYFMQHPDPQISQMAASIGIESHQLSRNFALNEGETQLRQRITHLILDFRMDIVSQQLKVLQRQLKEAGSDMQRIKELMTAYQDAQTLRNELARRLGSDVIVS